MSIEEEINDLLPPERPKPSRQVLRQARREVDRMMNERDQSRKAIEQRDRAMKRRARIRKEKK